MSDAANHLLVRSAHLPGNPAADEKLALMIANFQEWDELIPLAEAHSLAPLFYTHCQQLAIPLPSQVKLQLQGLYLRHKRANEIRLARLAEILTVLHEAQIPVIVLKGGVLASLVYPTPGLRPMSDLDILVPPEKAAAVPTILRDVGFTDALPHDPTPMDHRHLPVIMQTTDEMAVSVEVHHALGSTPLFPEGKSFDALWKTAVTYPFAGQTVTMLGYEDMLWHLYSHMISEHARLIRVVDIVGFAEKFVDQIDWATIRVQYPQLIGALSVLNFVMPLSAKLREVANIPEGPEPDGIDMLLHSWPPLPRQHWAGRSRRQIFYNTFFPTDASLRLLYGIPVNRSLLRARWLRHPFQVMLWSVQWRVP